MPIGMPDALRHLPGVDALKDTTPYQRARHKVALLQDERVNSHFTGFQRLPAQYDVLAGPIADALLATNGPEATVSIVVHGCSNGSEAYTVASVLTHERPELSFHIEAFDLVPDVVEHARTARYVDEEIFNNQHLRPGFVEQTFESDGNVFVVKPRIRERVDFDTADVLSDDLAAKHEPADVLFAQNFLFHLDRADAKTGLGNLLEMVKRGGYLFLDGVDLDLRMAFVREHGLEPVDHEIETIHEQARWARAVGWPYHYWGLEPFMTVERDWKRRYCTIFRRP